MTLTTLLALFVVGAMALLVGLGVGSMYGYGEGRSDAIRERVDNRLVPPFRPGSAYTGVCSVCCLPVSDPRDVSWSVTDPATGDELHEVVYHGVHARCGEQVKATYRSGFYTGVRLGAAINDDEEE